MKSKRLLILEDKLRCFRGLSKYIPGIDAMIQEFEKDIPRLLELSDDDFHAQSLAWHEEVSRLFETIEIGGK